MSHDSPATATVGPASNLAERQKTTAEVLTRCQEMTAQPDGCSLRFPRSKAWTERLEKFRAAWSQSCPHMSFDIAEEGGDLLLQIRGPDGTREFFENARYMLTSHLNPPPTLRNKLRQGMRLLSSPLRGLPDFLIIGAKKCGTTALYAYMTQHPRIAPAFRKEIYFFNACYEKGSAWYRSHFPSTFERGRGSERQLTGEATPDYLFHGHTAQRAFDMVPQARLIAILRNPIDRAYSFYNHNLRAGLETLSFAEAITQEDSRIGGERAKVDANQQHFSFALEHYSYKNRGVYVDQIENWLKVYPREQLLVLTTEALQGEPAPTLGQALDFLGLPYHAPREFKKLNAAPYPDMNAADRAALEEYFAPHNRRLYDFLGKDLGW